MISPKAASPRLVNAIAVLGFAWDREAFTASEAMSATGLTRSTVIGLCDDLLEQAWLTELADTRADGRTYLKGRPARRYAFKAGRSAVVGVDAGIHSVTTQVADLRGRVLARSRTTMPGDWPTAQTRLDAVVRGVDEAVAGAGIVPHAVLCVVVGVPAPTDAQGVSPGSRHEFWRRMNPGLGEHLQGRGWTTVVENDANLAAIGEGAVGAGAGIDSFVTLLAGERFGAGLVIDGRLLRGSRGGAGEPHPLALIDGVGDAEGVGALAREWARRARNSGRIPAESPLAQASDGLLDAEVVLRAADGGDPAAVAILDRLAERLARICAVYGGLLDVDRIVLAGGVAESVDLLLERAAPRLAELMDMRPPELVASRLGREVVSVGAVSRALAWVKDNLAALLAESAPESADVAATTGVTTEG